MASVTIDQVGKHFGAVEILRGVSAEISDGEFVVLIGPSGCGKSTLLRMIAGLEAITAGTISIGDRVVNDLPPGERDISMVFQSYALYPHMTVAQNLGFPLLLRKSPRAEIDTAVARAAEILGLGALLKRYPRHLSGGQRQRVAMGRSIVRDPAVFLFDEPLSNLDAKLRVQVRAEIKQLHQRLGTTTIYVTHDQIEAMTLADRIVVLRDGIVEQVGEPLDLYDRPANRFVAGFIGSPSMNFLDGTVMPEGFRTADGVLMPVSIGAPLGDLTYGIRPEHLSLDPNGVPVEVVVLEPTGSETQVIGRLGNQPIVGVFRERVRARPGEVLRIAPDLNNVHFFDTTGKRIGRN